MVGFVVVVAEDDTEARRLRLWEALETSDSTEGAGEGGADEAVTVEAFDLDEGGGRGLIGVFVDTSSSEGGTSKMSRSAEGAAGFSAPFFATTLIAVRTAFGATALDTPGVVARDRGFGLLVGCGAVLDVATMVGTVAAWGVFARFRTSGTATPDGAVEGASVAGPGVCAFCLKRCTGGRTVSGFLKV